VSRGEARPAPRTPQTSQKGLLNQAAGVDQLDYHLDRELQELARIADGSSFAEGLAAFFEKRSAHFEDSK
jgi:enoyl-CoA hydratase/carnithine racemase